MLITPEKAADRIEESGLDLVGAWKTVAKRHRKLAKKMPDFAEALSADPTARANSYHAQLQAVVQDQAESLAKVSAGRKLNMFTASLPPDLLLRFKYVGAGGPTNHSSAQQRLLARQQYTQEMLDDLEVEEPPTLVTCGYDVDGHELSTVTLRCDCIGRESWKLALFPSYEVLEEPMVIGDLSDPLPARIVIKPEIRPALPASDTLAG